MTNLQISPAYCALVNDEGGVVLRAIIDHLGLLESGGLETHQKQIGPEIVPCHTISLDTKYYTCQLPLLNFQTLDRFKTICGSERSGALEIFAVLFCAKQKLTEDFLALVSKYSSCLEKAEVKALVLCEDETDEPTTSLYSNDELLNKFALSRRIEIIRVGRNTASYLDDEEEGLNGVPRIIEAIETVRWPNLKMKPNPLGQQHKPFRLYNLPNTVDDDDFRQPDYPDTDDEDAILEWFDRPPINERITHLLNILPPQNKVTDLHQGNGGH